MWTSTLDLDPKRLLLMKLFMPFWRGACFTSLSPLRVQNLPRQALPMNNWVRVRNRLAGISGSDLHLLQGKGDPRIASAALAMPRLRYPGHEVVGEVIEVGEEVQRLQVGDRVVLQYTPNCVSAGVQNRCHACSEGNYNLCERGLLPGPRPLGGGWSEEMLLHEQMLYRVAPELSDEQAIMLEPTAVALHAVLRRLPKAGEQVLIIGAGTIGLLTLQILRALVPQARVSVLARHSFQVEQATRLGATHIIYPHDSYAGVQRATEAQRYQGPLGNRMLLGGFDVIYDTVGSNKTLHHALRWVRAHGAVVLVGTHLALMRIDLTPLWLQEIDLYGSLSHGLDASLDGRHERQETFGIAEQLMKDERIQPERLITHRIALNNYQEALLAALDKGQSQAIKVVFDYSLLPASVVPNVRASARRPRSAVVTSGVSRRPVTTDIGEERPQFPITPPPVPVEDESENTMSALPAIGKPTREMAAGLETPLPQSLEPEVLVAGQRGKGSEQYFDGDEETVVVRRSDVLAAVGFLPAADTLAQEQASDGKSHELVEDQAGASTEDGQDRAEESSIQERTQDEMVEPLAVEPSREETEFGWRQDEGATGEEGIEPVEYEEEIEPDGTEVPAGEAERVDETTNAPSQALQEVGKVFAVRSQARSHGRNNKKNRPRG